MSKGKSTTKNSKMIIVLLGRPGSGKGTQAKLLMKKFELEYFGSGDALRKRRKIKDFTSKKLFEVMTKGELVPSFIVSNLWIAKLEDYCKRQRLRGAILDGIPRRVIEAEFLDEALNWYGWQKQAKIFLIDISKKESFHRLTKRRMCTKCGRLIPWLGEFKKIKVCDKCGSKLITRRDDSRQAIQKRLSEFEKEVKKVIRRYQKQGKLIKINGEQSIENVFKDILKTLK